MSHGFTDMKRRVSLDGARARLRNGCRSIARRQIGGMATLTIRNLPEEVHLALKERARRNRRSVSQQVIAELAGSAGMVTVRQEERKRMRAEELMGMVNGMRGRMRGFMTAEEIDAAKREGRA